MTWIDPRIGGGGILAKGGNQGYMSGLLNWLQSPMAQGLSQGLLASSGPRLGPKPSLGEALGAGFGRGQELTDVDRQRKIQEGSLAETGRHNKSIEEIHRITQQMAKAKADAEEKRKTDFAEMLMSGANTGQQQMPAPNQQPPAVAPNDARQIAPQQPQAAPQQAMPLPQQQPMPLLTSSPFVGGLQHPGAATQTPGLLGGLPANEEPTPNEIARQIAQVQAATGQPGMLNTGLPEQPAQGQAAPPPSTPAMGYPGGTGGGGDDTVPIKIGNEIVNVPKKNYQKAKALYMAGELDKAAVALFEPPERTNLQKNLEAAGLKPGTPEYNAAALRNITKPAAEINLGEKAQELENKERIQRDSETLKVAREGAPAGRAASKYAKENYELATHLLKRGFDPHKYDLTKQMTRAQIISILGGKATAQDISDFEVLNKNAIRLQLELSKGLPAKGLNQYQEKQIAQASGSGVTMPTAQRLSVGLVHDAVEKQFADEFFTQYRDKYGTLDGALIAYHTWMDTMPELKFKEKGGIAFEDDRKIERDLSNWITKPGTPEYNEARLKYLRKKDQRFASDEELEFLAEFG